MRSTSAAAMLAVCALLAIGCANDTQVVYIGSPNGPPFTGPAPTLTTDQTDYVAVGVPGDLPEVRAFTIIANLGNTSGQTLYVYNCGLHTPTYGFHADPNSAYSPIYGCSGGMSGFKLLPHATRTDTLHVGGPNLRDGHTKVAGGSFSGTLTLAYMLATCPDVEGCNAGTIAATSTPFTVTATP